MKNVYAQVVKFTSKKDNLEHEAVQFVVHTPYGDYKSGYNFPTSLEFDIVKSVIEAQSKHDKEQLKDLGFEDDSDYGFED